MSDEQAGFRKDRSMVQQFLMLKLIVEKAKKTKLFYNCFVDFQKAFDSIRHNVTYAMLKSYRVGNRLVGILQNIGEISKSTVKVGREIGEWFSTI